MVAYKVGALEVILSHDNIIISNGQQQPATSFSQLSMKFIIKISPKISPKY